MGVELSAPGYNVFVSDLAGTSRGGTIAQMIEELHPGHQTLDGPCCVNKFPRLSGCAAHLRLRSSTRIGNLPCKNGVQRGSAAGNPQVLQL